MPVQKRLTIAVAAMAVIVTAVALRYGSRSAGGADSYGYISQADSWIAGELVQKQPFLAAPADRPPVDRWVFSPLGWKPAPGSWDIVPTYAAGYPLMLAAAKWIGGHAAMFAVVPLMTGLLVWSTFFLGVRLGRPGVGAVAAAIVGTSATILYMAMAPMSDIPSAALWTLTLARVLAPRRDSAFDAGASCALAILVRPNLLMLAAFMGAWLLWNDLRATQAPGRENTGFIARIWRGRALPFSAIAACGALVVSVINHTWYGSAAVSGYGDLSSLFAVSNIWPNIANYSRWLIEAETPLAAAGLLVVLLAPGIINRRRDVSGVPVLVWLIVAWVWGTYLYYRPFEWWWYLRFLLPTWPLIALGSASLIAWLWQRRSVMPAMILMRTAAVVIVGAAIATTIAFAKRHDTFRIGFTESRYPQVALDVAKLTDPASAVLTLQHSGSVRYYGGRMTVRWDLVERDQLGRLLAWLRERGHHPYLLVDSGELERVRTRFPDDPALEAVNNWPLATFFRNETMLYDLDAKEPSLSTPLGVYTHKAIPPATPPRWIR